MSGYDRPYDPPVDHHQDVNDKPKHVQDEIDRATATMNETVRKLAERGERVDHLQGQSEGLANNARGFNRRANKLRKDMWWKDMRMRICIIVGIIVLLIVIIVPSAILGGRH